MIYPTMERYKHIKILLTSAIIVGVFGLSACQSSAVPYDAETIPQNLPAATATAFFYDCVLKREGMTVEICTRPANKDIIREVELRRIIEHSSVIHKKWKPLLLSPLEALPEIQNSGTVTYRAWKIGTSGAGRTSYGCADDKPFIGSVILPANNGADEPESLGTAWHELEHLRRAYERFKNGELCPFKAPEREELEVDYWGNIIVDAARESNPNSPYTKEQFEDYGIDIYAAVARVLAPEGVGPHSNLYQIIYGPLQTIYFWTHRADQLATYPQDIQDKVKSAQKDWEEFQKVATPEENRAIELMKQRGVVATDFFPN